MPHIDIKCFPRELDEQQKAALAADTVSYTHLDVYKRQALMIGMDINRMFHGMAKTIETTPVAKRGISRHYAIFFTQKHRITCYDPRFHPGNAVICIHRLVIPDSRRIQHGVVINFRNGSTVGFAGKTEDVYKRQAIMGGR